MSVLSRWLGHFCLARARRAELAQNQARGDAWKRRAELFFSRIASK